MKNILLEIEIFLTVGLFSKSEVSYPRSKPEVTHQHNTRRARPEHIWKCDQVVYRLVSCLNLLYDSLETFRLITMREQATCSDCAFKLRCDVCAGTQCVMNINKIPVQLGECFAPPLAGISARHGHGYHKFFIGCLRTNVLFGRGSFET